MNFEKIVCCSVQGDDNILYCNNCGAQITETLRFRRVSFDPPRMNPPVVGLIIPEFFCENCHHIPEIFDDPIIIRDTDEGYTDELNDYREMVNEVNDYLDML